MRVQHRILLSYYQLTQRTIDQLTAEASIGSGISLRIDKQITTLND
jgi:hypothetical protein